eukprot:SAG11_NODE_2615_length_3170_cov_1.628460_4_plen_105_part_00
MVLKYPGLNLVLCNYPASGTVSLFTLPYKGTVPRYMYPGMVMYYNPIYTCNIPGMVRVPYLHVDYHTGYMYQVWYPCRSTIPGYMYFFLFIYFKIQYLGIYQVW